MTDVARHAPTQPARGFGRRAALADFVADRGALLLLLALAMAALLLAGLAMQAIGEPGGTNSYAALAEAFLDGRLHVDACMDDDCALYDGRSWVIFPPFPAVVAMPFVALFGPGFSGFILLAALASGVSLVLWWRIFERLSVEPATAVWLVLAIGFATPLYYVTIRGDGVWFFAQAIAFLLVAIAIHEAVRGGSLVLAGICIGLAFLTRQFTILYLPFLFALALRPGEPLLSLKWPHWRRALALGLPVAAALIVYLVYNQVRFGDPLDTGYGYIAAWAAGEDNMISNRLREHGLFSSAYLVFNALYLAVQGFHARFEGPYLTDLAGLDPSGSSLLAASPFVLLAVFAPMRRPVVIGLLVIAAMVAPMLFYHSNGFSQYNVQRYTLDWLPILFVMLALAVKPGLRPALQVLVTYAIGLNVVTVALLALTHGAG